MAYSFVISNSRSADKFVVRLPPGVRAQIASNAAKHLRSMNSEILSCIEGQFARLEQAEPAAEPAAELAFRINLALLQALEAVKAENSELRKRLVKPLGANQLASLAT